MRSAVVLLAAGSGRRVAGKTAKQFLPVNGEPLFMKSVRVFAAHPSVKEVVIVCQSRHHRRVLSALRRIKFSGEWKVVEGGDYRGASVRNGVGSVTTNPDVILIHDTARPFTTSSMIARVERAALKHGAALAAWPLPDTLKLTDGAGRVRKTIPRKNLWLAQTPQAFKFSVAQKCLLTPSPSATDDTELAERRGQRVHVIEGSATNFKVTYPADLELCRWLAK
jgi:2-C-methyl-D-erythritol 4-phosphate cytidylyltransferase